MRLKRAWTRLGWALLALLALGVVAAGVGVARFRAQAERIHRVPERALHAAPAATDWERGKHLVTGIAGCAECHGESLAGRVMDDNPLLRLSAPNITPAGVVASYRQFDWVRAILHGVDRRGASLAVMPAKQLRTFSDQDVHAMITYLQSVPAIRSSVPPTRVSWLGQALLGLTGEDLWPANSIAHEQSRAALVTPKGPTREHGSYLIGICRGCHGPELRGGLRHGPDAPPSADISPGAMKDWSREQLEQLFRHGKRRDGSQVSPAMPWRAMSRLSDDELTAMWLALRQ